MTSDVRSSRPAWTTDLALWGLALAVRALYLIELSRSPLFTMRIGDADAYLAWAARIAAGNWLGAGEGVFYQAPLYPYFLGTIFAVTGSGSLLAARSVQILLGATSCLLLCRAGRAWFANEKRTGAVAGVLLAVYPTAVFFDGLIQKSVLDSFFVCLLLALVGAAQREPRSAWRFWSTGLALGGLMLTRENAAVIVAVTLTWVALFFRGEPRGVRIKRAGFVVAGLALVVLPVALRNLVVGGEFHLSTSQLGPNFYMGNNAKAEGYYMPLRPGRGHAKFEREDATELAQAATGRTLSPGEVSSYWMGEAWRFIRSQPGRWSALLGKKLLLLCNDAEISDSEDQDTYADWSRVLRIPGTFWRFGVLLPLAVMGAVLTWPERRRIWFLHALVIAYAGSVVLFYVFARYRFPLIPPLVLFAAAGLTRAVACFKQGRRRTLLVAGAAALAAAFVANVGAGINRTRMRAVTLVNMGVDLLERQDRTGAAEALFQRAVQVYPPYAKAYLGLATARTRADDLEGALKDCELALRYGPEINEVRYEYGLALYRLNRIEQAEEQFRAAIALNPDSSYAYNALGLCRASRQQFDEAVGWYRKALERDPKNAEAHSNWGNALAKQGRFPEAAEQFRAAVTLNPDYRNARLRLGMALKAQGDPSAAAGEFRELLRRWPDDPDAGRLLRETESPSR